MRIPGRLFTLLFICLFTLIGCSSTAIKKRKSENLRRLAGWMSGYFRSTEQAEKDSSYYDISLRMIPIWRKSSDSYWLYVEQAVTGHEKKPYRQRVYKLIQISDNLFESRVYTLNNPLRFIGEWKEKNPLSGITPDSLKLREGCSILLRKSGDNGYTGNTAGKNCSSEINGAKYATSIVKITRSKLISWDRGFDSLDNQVWGATEGGYIFDKIEDYTVE